MRIQNIFTFGQLIALSILIVIGLIDVGSGKDNFLTYPYTLTSVCIFSVLFFKQFVRCWQGEFVEQSRASLVGDQFLDSQDLNVFFNVKHLQFAYVKNTAKKVTKASE